MIRALVLAAALLPGVAWAQGCNRAVPIQFAPGSSSGQVQGGVIRGEQDCYSIAARAGQTMRVEIKALEDNAVFQIYAPGWRLGRDRDGLAVGGRALRGAGEGEDTTRWTGQLQESGAHLIVVGGTRGNAGYRVTVTIQ